MSKTPRLICALLAALVLTSCGGQTITPETTTASDTTAEETTAAPEYVKPDKTFGGKTVNILLWERNQFAVTEETGDVVNDATYRRNSKVEELFDIKITTDVRNGYVGEYGTWMSTLNSSILAGDDAYQLAGGYGYRLTSDALNGNFMNVKDNPYIDFSKPWWPANLLEAADIGGHMTAVMGNIDPLYYDVTYAIFFNKKLAEENQLGDLYALVKDGKWTLDRLIEYSTAGHRDLNGDSKIDDEDLYGYITDWNMCIDAFIQACEIKTTEVGADGMPRVTGLSERYIDVQDKLKTFIKGSGAVRFNTDSDDDVKLFAGGHGLFYSTRFQKIPTLRAMDEDFGILPYPKWDEAQEDYVTYNNIGNATTFVVPITADETLTGCVLEALAYYGYKDIQPEYYERALKGKGTRDSESEEMLDIIFDNIKYEFTQVYSFSFGDQKAPVMCMRMSLKEDKDLASLWASSEGLFKETMDKLIDTLK